MSTNANYSSFFGGWTNGNHYTAASAAGFNALTFVAGAVIMIDGTYQVPSVPADSSRFIWGNLAADELTGWGIDLQVVSSVVSLRGRVAVTGALREVTFEFDEDKPSPVGRLMAVMLSYDGSNAFLSINGALVAFTALGASAYLPSALAPSMGGQTGVADTQAVDISIASCCYDNQNLAPAASVGGVADAWFRACREAAGGAYLLPFTGHDWLHRYEASQAVLSATPGTATKSASGALVATFATPPATVADVGNLGPTKSVGSAVNLAEVGTGPALLSSYKNVDWADMNGFSFPVPPPP